MAQPPSRPEASSRLGSWPGVSRMQRSEIITLSRRYTISLLPTLRQPAPRRIAHQMSCGTQLTPADRERV